MNDVLRSINIHPIPWSQRVKPLLYALALLYLAFMFLYRLDVSPTPWFDEGAFLNVAKTLAEERIYAESSAAGYRYTGPVVSTGPTVILPIALVFKLFGASILAGRVVVAFYGLLTFAVFYSLVKMLFGSKTAFVAAVLTLFSGSRFVVYIFRSVGGQGAGLFFLFVGLWLWLRRKELNSMELVIVGIMLGLSGISKFQYALFILPAILSSWILDLVWYQNKRWKYFIIPGLFSALIVFGWAYFTLFILGAKDRNIVEDMEILNAAGTNAYLVFELKQNYSNLVHLISIIPFGLFAPGTIYGLIISIPRTEDAQRYGILAALLLVSSTGYAISLGWGRNASPIVFIAAPFIARLLAKLTSDFRLDWEGIRASFGPNEQLSTNAVMSIVVIGFAGALLATNVAISLNLVVVLGSDSIYQVSEYLDTHVPGDNALIETWEKELSIVTDHDVHFPPDVVETYRNMHMHGLGPPTYEKYDFRDYGDPDFVITGRFSKSSEIYPLAQLAGYDLVQSFGGYDIYRRKRGERQ